MKLFETKTCGKLPQVPPQLKQEIETAERTSSHHRALMDELSAMHLIEIGGVVSQDAPLPHDLTVAAWNVERCLDVKGSAKLLQSRAPDIVLLSEMDSGMARTGQKNTTREIAELLGMNYAYVLEFYELDLGSAIEIELATDNFNEFGWHGNALLSRTKPKDVALIRLDDHGHWFCKSDANANEPRVGGRVAVAAILETEGGQICTVSTHLESAGSIAARQSQMDRIMAAVDIFAPDMPVIIGGDLNTGNNLPDPDWKQETLFEAAERQGYSWSSNDDGTTTRPSRLTRFPDKKMKLDWLAHRDLKAERTQIIEALDDYGVPLSDHELLVGKFEIQI
jgi:endonuclease/exonuclease/phosphatase family metal-dependent hydrolase